MAALRTLETLHFDNTFARLPDAFYAKVTPTPLKNPFLVSVNPDAAVLLDLDPEEAKRPEFAGSVEQRPIDVDQRDAIEHVQGPVAR